jgi:hypothetical protein
VIRRDGSPEVECYCLDVDCTCIDDAHDLWLIDQAIEAADELADYGVHELHWADA